MKIIDLNSALELFRANAGPWIFSLADWRFQVEWDDNFFKDLAAVKIFEVDCAGGREGEADANLGFFLVPGNLDLDRLLSLFGHQATRLFVCADAEFFDGVSMNLFRAASDPYNQLSEHEILELSKAVGYKLMLIRDGDEGDYFYYCFAGDDS